MLFAADLRRSSVKAHTVSRALGRQLERASVDISLLDGSNPVASEDRLKSVGVRSWMERPSGDNVYNGEGLF